MVENTLKVILPKTHLEFEYFKDPNKAQDFLCAICHRVPHPDKAVEEVECGHIFCEECLKEWTKIKETCPHCNNSINNSQRPLKAGSKIAYRILMELMVNCPTGCSWSGVWNDLDKHLADCEKSIADCKYAYIGCSFKGELAERKEHETLKDKYHLELAEAHIEKLNEIVKEKKKRRIVEYVVGNAYTVSVHRHPLIHTPLQGWACDGRRIIGGCKSGFKGYKDTLGAPGFRCDSCDYDLCARCLEAYLVN